MKVPRVRIASYVDCSIRPAFCNQYHGPPLFGPFDFSGLLRMTRPCEDLLSGALVFSNLLLSREAGKPPGTLQTNSTQNGRGSWLLSPPSALSSFFWGRVPLLKKTNRQKLVP